MYSCEMLGTVRRMVLSLWRVWQERLLYETGSQEGGKFICIDLLYK